MLRRRKESVLFCPNVSRISFCVHFATCYDGDFDGFDVTINIKKITLRQQVATGGKRWQHVATSGVLYSYSCLRGSYEIEADPTMH